MQISLTQKRVTEFLMLLISGLAGWYVFDLHLQSPGLEGGMDSYNHYIIARYAWQHPTELLLHQWGKPIYNILASPFANFGLSGVVFLNILSWIGSSWLIYFTAVRLKFRLAFAAFFFALASPIFFDNLISGLTEPLCALILSLSVYLFASERVNWAAVVAGFLPYARSEGFVIIAVFGFYLLFILKNYRGFLLLIAGSVVMNMIGWIVEGEALWIFTSNPYIKVQAEKINLCGNGPLLHYVSKLKYVMGKVPLIFFVSGVAIIAHQYILDHRSKQTRILFYPVLGVYALYFVVHSLIWYLGVMGSCGYERVLAVIAPLAGLIMAYSFDMIVGWIYGLFSSQNKTLVFWLAFLACNWLLYIPDKVYGHKYPIDISKEQHEFVKVAEWYKTKDYSDRMHYFLYPYLNILLDIDPKDTEHFIQLWSFDFQYAPVGSIVIWDGHFGPNESQLPLADLMEHPDFKLIQSFIPEEPFKTSNDYDFEIHVFERVRDSSTER